jgi:hypothetical protein
MVVAGFIAIIIHVVAVFIAIIIHVGCWFYRNNYSCWLLFLSEF